MILRIFLIFDKSEPHDSYKKNSYKKKSVYSTETLYIKKTQQRRRSILVLQLILNTLCFLVTITYY